MFKLFANSTAGKFCAFVVLLVGWVGCNRTATSRLVGHWEGRPDSAVAYADRQQAVIGDKQSGDATAASLAGGQLRSPVTKKTDFAEISPGEKTELEQYDIQIVLDLRADGSVVMWRDSKQEELSGNWKVLDAVGPQVRLQITARHDSQPPIDEIRNFQLELSEDGNAFTLAEEGADPQFGSLYFRRQK